MGQHGGGGQDPGDSPVQVPAPGGRQVLVDGLAVQRVGKFDRWPGSPGPQRTNPVPSKRLERPDGSLNPGSPGHHRQRRALVYHGQGRR